MCTFRTPLVLAIVCVFSTIGFGQSTNLLSNGDFENGYPDLTGWILRGSSTSINHSDNPGTNPNFGDHTLTICGEFSDPSLSSAFVYQIMPAIPGDIFNASADLQVSTSEPLVGNHLGFIRIAFFSDPDGQVELGGYNSAGVNSTSLPGHWMHNTIDGAIAPAGTTHIGYYMFFQKPGPDRVHSEDTVFFDNATLSRLTTSTLAAPTPVPTMSEWGLIILLLLLSIFGVVSIKSEDQSLIVA